MSHSIKLLSLLLISLLSCYEYIADFYFTEFGGRAVVHHLNSTLGSDFTLEEKSSFPVVRHSYLRYQPNIELIDPTQVLSNNSGVSLQESILNTVDSMIHFTESILDEECKYFVTFSPHLNDSIAKCVQERF